MRLPMLVMAVASGVAVGGVPAAAGTFAWSSQDSAFVSAAGYAGNFEVAGGELAQARAASDDVRVFGARTVSDHNRAGAKLAGIARQNGATMPDLPDSAGQNILKAWSRLDGLVFDCSYVPAEYLDHVGAIGLFENEAAHGTNADLVQFARDTLPTLQEHKRMISAALSELDCSG
jgi:putative membrane protein